MSIKKWLTHNKKVIVLEPKEWRFWDFTQAVNNAIEDWYNDELSENAQNLFNSILKINRKVENPTQWGDLKFLKGKAGRERIWELRFYCDKRAYRVLGYFGPERKQATLLIGCYHKQGVYEPADALDTAIKRKKMLEEGRASFSERQVRTDI